MGGVPYSVGALPWHALARDPVHRVSAHYRGYFLRDRRAGFCRFLTDPQSKGSRSTACQGPSPGDLQGAQRDPLVVPLPLLPYPGLRLADLGIGGQ